MSKEERVLTIKLFITVISLLVAVWSGAYGYSWVRLNTVEGKVERTQDSYMDANSQLSQIQTDINWIKQTMSGHYNK